MNYPAQTKTSEGRPGARFGRVASPGAGFDHAVKEKYPRSVRPHSRSQGSLSDQEGFWAAVFPVVLCGAIVALVAASAWLLLHACRIPAQVEAVKPCLMGV